jgi:cold-inducible RNA-binding protein
MSTKLFVGGLAWATTDATLRDFFAQAGNVVSANVITDKFSGKSKGFGFVEMASEQEAADALEKLNGQMLDGRAIAASEARPREPRDNNFSGGNRGGGGRSDYRRDDRGGDRRGGGGGNRY